MGDERELTEAVLRKYRHPLSAVRHLLTMYDTLPATALTRMSRNILIAYPPTSYGSMPIENRMVFEREVRQRDRNIGKALQASRIPTLSVAPSQSRTRSRRSRSRRSRSRRSRRSMPSVSAVPPAPAVAPSAASKPSEPKRRGFFETLFE